MLAPCETKDLLFHYLQVIFVVVFFFFQFFPLSNCCFWMRWLEILVFFVFFFYLFFEDEAALSLMPRTAGWTRALMMSVEVGYASSVSPGFFSPKESRRRRCCCFCCITDSCVIFFPLNLSSYFICIYLTLASKRHGGGGDRWIFILVSGVVAMAETHALPPGRVPSRSSFLRSLPDANDRTVGTLRAFIATVPRGVSVRSNAFLPVIFSSSSVFKSPALLNSPSTLSAITNAIHPVRDCDVGQIGRISSWDFELLLLLFAVDCSWMENVKLELVLARDDSRFAWFSLSAEFFFFPLLTSFSFYFSSLLLLVISFALAF